MILALTQGSLEAGYRPPVGSSPTLNF
jgi:hypothetical protein